jgi:gamma-glutamyltranspeptidase/glutathione hydrolase
MRDRVGGFVLGLGLLTFSGCSDAPPSAVPMEKLAQSPSGMVATGSEPATAAGVEILERGGNAADAAAAAAFALMVTDPANTSLGGRVQLLVFDPRSGITAIDGATRVPTQPLPEREDPTMERGGFATVPVPGSVAALERLVRDHGRLPLETVMEPAIRLATEGFEVPERLAQAWARAASALALDPGASAHYLKPDGSAFQAGERFYQPALALLLQAIADSGSTTFYHGSIAERLSQEIAEGGGFTSRDDFAAYEALDGEVVGTVYRDRQVFAAGGRGWGDTLVQMLNMLAQFQVGLGDPSGDELELMARIIAQAMADRPQVIGSLAPRPDGIALSTLSSLEFAQQRAGQIRSALRDGHSPATGRGIRNDDTSHLSVMDAEGNAVALTTSIGPAFGARVASPTWGMLFAHSYRMRAQPEPGARDLTEMTPTIVMSGDRPELVLGAAGSERIPTSVFQVISHVVDRGWNLERAMRAPRIFALGGELRAHDWLDPSLQDDLASRGFEIRTVSVGDSPHLGLVHAAGFDPMGQIFVGVADDGDSGAAAGPGRKR